MDKQIIRGVVIACTAFCSGVGLGYLFGKKSAQRGTTGPQRGYCDEEAQRIAGENDFIELKSDETAGEHLPEIPDGVNVIEDGVKVWHGDDTKPSLESLAGQYVTIDPEDERAGGRTGDRLVSDMMRVRDDLPVRCTKEEYIGSWPDYDRHTVTWFKINDVLYDNDARDRIVGEVETIEKIGPWAKNEIDKFEMENVQGEMYVVDHANHICYEILEEDEEDYREVLESEEHGDGA